MAGSGAASSMSGRQIVSMLGARANALRTATTANFDSRRRHLSVGLNIARAWRGANPGNTQLSAVNEAVRRAYYTYQRQRPPTTRTVSAAGKEQAPTRRRVMQVGATRKRPTTRRQTSGRADVTEVTEELMSLPDQPGFSAGLVDAVRRTVTANVGPAGLLSLWNPPGPILSRPLVRLTLISGGLFTATALAVWALSPKKKKSNKK